MDWSYLLSYTYQGIGFAVALLIALILAFKFAKSAVKYVFIIAVVLGILIVLLNANSVVTNLVPNIDNVNGKEMLRDVQKKKDRIIEKVEPELEKMLKRGKEDN